MQQYWNQNLQLADELVKQCEALKPTDIMVGVLCKDVETTILNVLNVINEGLYRYFPDYKKSIVVCEGGSTDQTMEAIDLFHPYKSVDYIVTHDITNGGKGAGVMTVLECAHYADAKCVVLMDGDLLSVKPQWVHTIANPIKYGRADLTVPYYIRDKNDGVITNNLVYPFTRALYGIDIRQPIAGEFALSKNLYEVLRNHPKFPPDFGVDIFIVTVAAAEGMYVKEGLYSLKIHESTTRYLDPEKFLIPMFRKVTGSMFELAGHYEEYWKNRPKTPPRRFYHESFSKRPIPVKIDVDNLKQSFITEFDTAKELMKQYLPESIIKELSTVVNDGKGIDSELWAEIVYNYAAAYKDAKDEPGRYLLLDSLKTLWIGRFVSYAMETKDMDINEAEVVLQKQAEVFEDKLDYLCSNY